MVNLNEDLRILNTGLRWNIKMAKRTEPDLGYISTLNRMDENSFEELMGKLLGHLGLEIITSQFGGYLGDIEARVKGAASDSVYPFYHIKVSRKKDMVEPEDLQEFVSVKENDEEGLIFLTTSGFSDNARLYAQEFDIDIVDYEVLGSMLRKFGIFKDIMARRDKNILKGEKGRYLPSIEELENIIESGNRAFAKKNYYDALNYFSKAIDLKPSYDTAWYMKGVILNNLKKPNEALEAFMKALENNVENEKAWYSMGLVLYSMGRYEEEIECYDKAIEIKKDFLSAWNNKGTTLLQLERYDEAILCYDEILRQNPDFKMAWNNRGIALKKLRRTDEALDCFSNATQIDPNYLDAWFNKGQIHLDSKQYKKAFHCFETILRSDSKNIQVLYGRGKALEGAGQYSNALKCYDQIIALDPRFYAAKRRKKKAQKYLELKGDSQLDDDFFNVESDDEFSMVPRIGVERILVKRTETAAIPQPEEPKLPKVDIQAPVEPQVMEHETTLPPPEPDKEKIISETKALMEMKNKLQIKEQELTEMERWLSEKYEAYEKDQKEKNFSEETETLAKERKTLYKEKEALDKERDELAQQAKAIAKAKAAMSDKESTVFSKEEEMKRRLEEMEKKASGMAESEKNMLAFKETLKKEKEELESEKLVIENEKTRLAGQTKGIAKAKQNLVEKESELDTKEEELIKRYKDMEKNTEIITQKERELEEAALKIKKRQDELELQVKILRDKERSIQEDIRLRSVQVDEEQPKGFSAETTVSSEEMAAYEEPIALEEAEERELDSESEVEEEDIVEPKIKEPELPTLVEDKVPQLFVKGEALLDREALALYSLGNFEDVEDKIEELVSQNLESKLIWNMMGNIERNKNNSEEAFSCYEKAFKLDQNYIITLTNLLSVCNELDRLEEANNYCTKILGQRENDEKFILEKALILARLGQLDEAVSTIDNLIKINDNLEAVWNVRGILMHNLNQSDYAILSFDKALKINPKFQAALNNKGTVYYHDKKYETALECFESALEIRSHNQIEKNRKLTLKELGLFEEKETKEEEKETDSVAKLVSGIVKPPKIQEDEVTEEVKEEETEAEPIDGTLGDLLDLGGAVEEKEDTETSLFMCPSCGSFVSETSDLCPSCGYDFASEEGELIEESEEEEIGGKALEVEDVDVAEDKSKEPPKEEIIKELMNISGIGLSKAGALYDAGFKSIDDLIEASIAELAEVKGIGRTLAKIIKKRLESRNLQGG
jgi:tetratricopeptide (TPR) repeat protein